MERFFQTKLQVIALCQIGLLLAQVLLAAVAMVNLSKPEFPDSSVNSTTQILALLLLPFIAISIPAVVSAFVLLKPTTYTPSQLTRNAFNTQRVLFYVCITLIIPAIALALNGFPYYAIDCILGIFFWPLVKKFKDLSQN